MMFSLFCEVHGDHEDLNLRQDEARQLRTAIYHLLYFQLDVSNETSRAHATSSIVDLSATPFIEP